MIAAKVNQWLGEMRVSKRCHYFPFVSLFSFVYHPANLSKASFVFAVCYICCSKQWHAEKLCERTWVLLIPSSKSLVISACRSNSLCAILSSVSAWGKHKHTQKISLTDPHQQCKTSHIQYVLLELQNKRGKDNQLCCTLCWTKAGIVCKSSSSIHVAGWVYIRQHCLAQVYVFF